MNWSRTRAVTAVGVLGIVALGALLLKAARGDPAAALPWRWLMVALAAAPAALAVGRWRRHEARPASLVMLLLAVGLGFGAFHLSPARPATAPTPAPATSPVAAATVRLENLVSHLETWPAGLAAELVPGGAADPGGSLFRSLETLPERWAAENDGRALPLAAVVWRGGQRVAWTTSAVPLADPAPELPAAVSGLLEYRGQWYLRRLQPAPGGQLLELQWALGGTDASWSTVSLDVEPGNVRRGPGVGEVDPDGASSPLVVRVRPAPGAEPAVALWSRSRLLGAMLLGWTLLLGTAAWRPAQPVPFLAALWTGRAFLAAADLRRWLVAAFPGVDYPTSPGSWSSLIDPAYFATPVLGGWFASTGDALLSAALLAYTVWRLQDRPDRSTTAAAGPGHRSGNRRWLPALGFGLLAGVLFPAWRALDMLVAENANARLIGPGVTLTFLTFWGLHVVLLLIALSALGVLVRASVQARPAGGDGRARAGPAGLVLAVAAAAASWPLRGSPVAALIVGALAALLWWARFGVPGLSGGGRRIVWPALVLMAALWNYASLRQVHDAAERAWLQRRAGAITEADAGWTRFLVQSVLTEMQQADEFGPERPPAELWRDEAAWRLYRDSALYDLSYPSLIEILDRDERSLSLFATGFLRDFRYETMTRSAWLTADGAPAGPDDDIAFQAERRLYSGGQEEILVAEAPRRSGRGWLRIETPLRSWRISTLASSPGDAARAGGGRYRPRLEVDRPVLMLLADDGGWRGSGVEGFPGAESDGLVSQLRSGRREWAAIPVGGATWLCRWTALPPSAARAPGEGFLVGIRRATVGETLLDISRLVLVDVLLLVGLVGLVGLLRGLRRWRARSGGRWQPGFQEKFLAGYLVLGLLLLLVVGLSVDRVGYERVRGEARQQAREGLTMALQQLGGLLADQARALADSGRLDALTTDAPQPDPEGNDDLSRTILFRDDGHVLFDGSPLPLTSAEAQALLQAVRAAPVVLIRERDEVQAVVAVPVALGGGRAPLAAGSGDTAGPGHGGIVNDGVLLLRQSIDGALVAGLADVLRGEVTVSLDGTPAFASHAEGLFEGERPPLLDPGLMATLFDHPQGPGLASPPGRPFACDAAQPLPAFARDGQGRLARRLAPAVLGVSFPGREREFAAQRRATVLFLAGLANLILLTALLLAALMSWNLFRPLRVLMGATQSLARGDFAAPLPPAGHDEVGRLAGAFGAMRSRLQHAQDDLAARERFLATVLERVTVGVAVLSPAGDLVVVNPAGRAILARFWPEESPGAAAGRLRAGLGMPLTTGAAVPAATGELAGDNGRLTLRGAVAPLEDDAPDGDQMIVFEDVSEFLATKKLALNAELARQIAHEIKNPLTPIQLSVQLLGQAWRDRHPQLERIVPDTVERVLGQVDLLRRIASEFSLLGRPDELPLTPVDLPALVARVATAYAGPAGADADGSLCAAEAPAGLPLVMAHEESLLKILGNLMQNSLDAARPGTAPLVETDWLVEGNRVRLRWRDNGAGLPTDVADRLFEPYFSTKSKGTGLGLAICRSLAERMGGHISLSNRADGPGAEAVLDLAAAAGPKGGT